MKRLLRPTTDSHHLKVKRVKGSTCLWIKFHANSTYLKKSFHTACKSPAFFHSNQCLVVNNKTIVMFSLTIENCYLVLHNYIVSYLFINNFEPKVLQIFNKNADFSYDVTFLIVQYEFIWFNISINESTAITVYDSWLNDQQWKNQVCVKIFYHINYTKSIAFIIVGPRTVWLALINLVTL